MRRQITWIAAGSVLAILALVLLAPRSHYMPGPLLAAHGQLTSECATCHTPWRGPNRQGCIDCHGEGFSQNNPHGGFDVTEQSQGLLPGRELTTTSQHNLQCLSCHSEHQGAVVDINATATFACTWCHQHPSIGKVPDHVVAVMRRKFFVRHRFSQPFDHHQHKLLIDAAAPPRPGGFKCESCHRVAAVTPGTSDRMSFKWSGCAGSGCHLTPQDKYLRMPASVGAAPQTVAYLSAMTVRHINAVFNHSPGHLRYACADCHFKMAASKNPDDADSLGIKQCFTCHAHQPAPLSANAQTAASTPHGVIEVAFAATAAPSAKRVVACGDCHLFHTYGVIPQRDFAAPAPKFPPNAPPHAHLTLYLPGFHAGAGVAGLTVYPVKLSPWWLGWLAFAVVALGAVVYLRYVPAQVANQEAVAGVAPQRTREVPSLDDIFQSSVRHLYIVGEAAGTASINLAMRSGRQVIEAIAGELKHMMPPVAPDLYDVVIVGCGPAGLGATATAKAVGLNYATLEKMTPASTLRSYPRAKFVQATPIDIAEYGSFFLEGDDSRENLIREWEKIISQMGLVINDREDVVDVVHQADCFLVKTARGHVFKSRCV
ncbi:MAG: NAD(P)-binding domain-containing protein, partial [Candidatus Binataceae bacterium]